MPEEPPYLDQAMQLLKDTRKVTDEIIASKDDRIQSLEQIIKLKDEQLEIKDRMINDLHVFIDKATGLGAI